MGQVKHYVKAEIPTRQYGNVEIGCTHTMAYAEGDPAQTALAAAQASKLNYQMTLRSYEELRMGVAATLKSFVYVGGEVDGKSY